MDVFEEFRIEKTVTKSNESGLFNVKKLIDWTERESKAIGKAVIQKRVNKPRQIVQLAMSNGIICIGTSNSSIVRFIISDLTKDLSEEIEVSARGDDCIDKVFVDPSGHHILIAMRSSELYYLHSKSIRCKKLSRLQGNVECVAFDKQSCSDVSTKSFLIGTTAGLIYEMHIDSSGKEKICQNVYQVDPPISITSIYLETVSAVTDNNVSSSTSQTKHANPTGGIAAWSSSASSALMNINPSAHLTSSSNNATDSKYFVMFATSSPTRLYYLSGGPNLSQLFAANTESHASNLIELPGDIQRAELHCYSLSSKSLANSFALMTEMGIYHGSLQLDLSTGVENAMIEARLMPFASSHSEINETKDMLSRTNLKDRTIGSNRPISIALTEFHFLTLRQDRLQIMSKLNGNLVQEEILNLGDGDPIALVRDPMRNIILFATNTQILQVITVQEDRDVWRIYLDKAISNGEDKMFEAALKYVHDEKQRKIVVQSQAEFYFFTANDPDRAATLYARSGLPFDEIALRLLNLNLNQTSGPNTAQASPNLSFNVNLVMQQLITSGGPQLNPLRVYLLEVLKVLPSTSKSQRTMVSTWLCEIFLHQIEVSRLSASLSKTEHSTSIPSIASSSAMFGNTAVPAKGSAAKNPSPSYEQQELKLTNQFKDFLRAYRSTLDLATVFNLIINRNERQLLLFYARIEGDFHRVISLLLTEKNYVEAIRVLESAPIEKVSGLIYKTAPVLIEVEAEATVNMLIAKPQLSMASLLPALLRYSYALDKQLEEERTAFQSKPIKTNMTASSTPLRKVYPIVPLNSNYEGKKVNFAIRYLKVCLFHRYGLKMNRRNKYQKRSMVTTSSMNQLNSAAVGMSEEKDVEDEDIIQYPINDTMAAAVRNYPNSPEPATFHTLLWLTAKYDESEDEEDVVALLDMMIDIMKESESYPGSISAQFDVQYMLRQCQLFNKTRSVVLCFLLLGDPMAAVEAALKVDLELSKLIASNPEYEDELRRSLWIAISKYVISNEVDMRKPIALIKESSGILTIDDLLPLLADFTEIDLFKDELCQTLEACGSRIMYLKSEMELLAESADSTVKELDGMKNRAYSTANQNQRCEYCSDTLYSKQFYLFPCSHGFHTSCLLRRAHRHLDVIQLHAVREIEESLRNLSLKTKESDSRARAQQESLQAELDGFIAADCPLCGYAMIRSIGLPLISPEDENEVRSWELITDRYVW